MPHVKQSKLPKFKLTATKGQKAPSYTATARVQRRWRQLTGGGGNTSTR